MPTDPQETIKRIKIALWLIAGFVVGVIVSLLVHRDPYDIIGSVCVSGIVIPICTFAFGVIGAWRNTKG